MKNSATLCGLASIALALLTSRVEAIVINLGGTNYEITASSTTYAAAESVLSSNPWFGNSALAAEAARLVGTALGLPNSNPPFADMGPVFAYEARQSYGYTSVLSQALQGPVGGPYAVQDIGDSPTNTFFYATATPEAANALQFGDFTYTATATEVTITGYIGAGVAVVIPASIDGKPVTSIGENVFNRYYTITSVAIPDTVTTIGALAFAYCTRLTSVTIPNSVTSIGNEAFFQCTGLTSVTIGSGVKSIGSLAFYDCRGLTSVTIPNSVTSIGFASFAGCSGLTSVTIPSSVTSIGDAAFSGCSGLTNIEVVPNNLTYTSVGGVLYNKNQTTLIQFSAGRSGSYTIPDSVTSIGDAAFYGCSGLTSVTIGSGVTSIGIFAFDYCSGITHFVFTGNAPNLEPESFFGVPVDATVRYSSASTGWGAAFGGLTTVADYLDVLTYSTANNQVTITGYTGAGGALVIPASIGGTPVTAIGENAFLDSSSLTSFTMPDSVISIGNNAFNSCTGLTGVTIPSSVTSIGNSAFQDCKGLSSVTIGSSVTSIGSNAFQGCKGLTSVTIPSSVTSIGSNAFRSCTGLSSVAIPDSVISIGLGAFSGCSSLSSVTIGSGVTSIGLGAFSGCSGLTSVTIPASVTSIGDRAFFGCSALTRVMIPVATVLGIDASPPTTTVFRYLSEAQLASRDNQQNAVGRVLGQADVTSAPNTHGLYNLSQVQALNVDTPLLAKDSATGKFKLTIGVEKSTNLVNFSPMAIPVGAATINAQGKMEFEFTAPDNAAFFRIESR